MEATEKHQALLVELSYFCHSTTGFISKVRNTAGCPAEVVPSASPLSTPLDGRGTAKRQARAQPQKANSGCEFLAEA